MHLALDDGVVTTTPQSSTVRYVTFGDAVSLSIRPPQCGTRSDRSFRMCLPFTVAPPARELARSTHADSGPRNSRRHSSPATARSPALRRERFACCTSSRRDVAHRSRADHGSRASGVVADERLSGTPCLTRTRSGNSSTWKPSWQKSSVARPWDCETEYAVTRRRRPLRADLSLEHDGAGVLDTVAMPSRAALPRRSESARRAA